MYKYRLLFVLLMAAVNACGATADTDDDGDGGGPDSASCLPLPPENAFQHPLALDASYPGIPGTSWDVALLDGKAFVASDQGITVIDIATGDRSYRTMAHGLPGRAVNTLEVIGNKLIAGTSLGFVVSEDGGDTFCGIQLSDSMEHNNVISMTGDDDNYYVMHKAPFGSTSLSAVSTSDLTPSYLRNGNWDEVKKFGNQLVALGDSLKISENGGLDWSTSDTEFNRLRTMAVHAGSIFLSAELLPSNDVVNYDLFRSTDGQEFEFLSSGYPIDSASNDSTLYMMMYYGSGQYQLAYWDEAEDQAISIDAITQAASEDGYGRAVAADSSHVAVAYATNTYIYDIAGDEVLWQIPNQQAPESDIWTACGATVFTTDWNAGVVSFPDGGRNVVDVETTSWSEITGLDCADDLVIAQKFDHLDISTDGGETFIEGPTIDAYIYDTLITDTHVFVASYQGVHQIARSNLSGDIVTIITDETTDESTRSLRIFDDKLYAIRPTTITVHELDGSLLQTITNQDWDYITDVFVAGDTIFLAAGTLHVSHDGGQTFTDTNAPAKDIAFFDGRLYIAGYDPENTSDQIRVSDDQGASFSEPLWPHELGIPSPTYIQFVVRDDRLWARSTGGIAVLARD